MIKKERVLITVKTYPTLSTKYGELVCTAGVREDGSWVRIYPLPFRRFEQFKQFKKYSWIEMQLKENSEDHRPESFRPAGGWDDIKVGEWINTTNNWEERKKFVLGKGFYDNLSTLIEKAKNNELSLAVFKPSEICDFVSEEDEAEWDPKKLEIVLQELRQRNLFEQEEFVKDFKLIKKLPYKFSYVFKDKEGKKSTMMLEDWEVGQLFWNCRDKARNDQEAIDKVKQKYLNEFVEEKDLYFFLGTTKQFHYIAPNPYIIIGTFYPPKEIQRSLF